MPPPRADRPLILTERVRRACRLAPDDVAFLLERHAAHFELAPTGRRHVYRLTPGGCAGVVTTPTRRLVVRPKIPLANLFFLLDPLAPYPAAPDSSTPGDGAEALDFLAGQLALRLRQRADAGLQRGYDERRERGPFLLGQLDVAAQLRAGAALKERLHCRFDDFTADVPCNRLAKAAAERVLAAPLLRDGTRAALRQALRGFEAVTPAALTPEAWAAADDAPESYRPLLDLCRLLVEALAPGEASGPSPGPAFLLDLERVFERFLTALVRRATEGRERWRVEAQPLLRVCRPAPGRPDLHVRPDLLLRHDGRPARVVDAKWKRLGRSPLVTADVYQMLAYCAALGVRRAELVYPGRRDRAWRYDLERGPCRVVIRTLRVAGPREMLERSARRLGRLLTRAPGDTD